MKRRARIPSALPEALRRAGLPARCPIHPLEAKPCRRCDAVFDYAKAQQRQQREAEQKRLHAEYLASGKAAA